MKFDYQHVLLLLSVVLPAIALSLQGHFAAGSAGALVVVTLSAVGLALKASVIPSVTANAAIKNAAEEVVK
jgi:hypothetical protein